jgi:hypothetical protein
MFCRLRSEGATVGRVCAVRFAQHSAAPNASQHVQLRAPIAQPELFKPPKFLNKIESTSQEYALANTTARLHSDSSALGYSPWKAFSSIEIISPMRVVP